MDGNNQVQRMDGAGSTFEFTDYTVLSEWERLTERLTERFREYFNKHNDSSGGSGGDCSWELTYREVAMRLFYCSGRASKYSPLAMFDHFAYPIGQVMGSPEERLERLPQLIHRVFSRDRFFLLGCADDTMVVTVDTAKLLLGSLIMAVQQALLAGTPPTDESDCIVPPLFVAFGEANLVGVDMERALRLSLVDDDDYGARLDSLVTMLPLNVASLSLCSEIDLTVLEASPLEGLYRHLADTLMSSGGGGGGSTSRLRSPTARPNPTATLSTLTRIHQWIPWGGEGDPVERLVLEGIFPKISHETAQALIAQNGGCLPDPLEAPIILLSRHSRALLNEELGMSMGLERLASLMHRSVEEPLMGENDWLNARTRMRQVPIVQSAVVDSGATFSLLQGTFQASRQNPPWLFDRRLGKALLLQLLPNLQAALTEAILAGIPRISQFWMEVVGALRRSYDNLQPIPDCPDQPDPSGPVLLQKLAMLQYCIGRARQDTRRHLSLKDSLEPTTKSVRHLLDPLGEPPRGPALIERLKGRLGRRDAAAAADRHHPQEDARSEEDEFYDPLDNSDDDDSMAEGLDDPKDEHHRLMGRLRKTEMRLLEDPDEPLWIPVTQEMGPMTSDQVQIYQDTLVKLSTTTSPSSDEPSTAIDTKVRIQSGQLISDMSAFKSANPRAVLADFVRWHSPKDWIVGGDGGSDGGGDEGQLSVRMQGRVWREMWEQCEACPAHQQVPLFDHVREAEKALFYLEDACVGELFSAFLPTWISLMAEQLQLLTVEFIGTTEDQQHLEVTERLQILYVSF